jgi:hypothetical protein
MRSLSVGASLAVTTPLRAVTLVTSYRARREEGLSAR